MSESKRWVRHLIDGEPQWSPYDVNSDSVKKVGPMPNSDAIQDCPQQEFEDLDLLPVSEPTRVVALAKNRVNETQSPLLFLMTPSSVVGDGTPIQMPTDTARTWAEMELGMVIDKTARDVPTDAADEYIGGYTVSNDVTTEPNDDRDWHLPKGKARDTFCPVSPFLVTELDTQELEMTTYINGDITHTGSTTDNKLNPLETLSYVTSFLTLQPGDIVLTGTPPDPFGSELSDGDEVKVEIESVGHVSNPVEYK